MRGCCPPPGAEIFTERVARRDAARYRRRGLGKVGRRLIELVAGTDGDVLEIGGGVGALQIELLRTGAAEHAVNVELSPAYEPEAATLLEESGLEQRVERLLLDFGRDAAEVEPADIVLMNRVICCYPDMPALVGAAAERTRRVLALSYPPDTWPFRAVALVINLWCRVSRKEFRFFVHSPAAILRVAAEHGLSLGTRERRALWELAALERRYQELVSE